MAAVKAALSKDNHPEGTVVDNAVCAVLERYEDKSCPLTGELLVTEELKQVFRNQAKRDITVDGKLCGTFDLLTVLAVDTKHTKSLSCQQSAAQQRPHNPQTNQPWCRRKYMEAVLSTAPEAQTMAATHQNIAMPSTSPILMLNRMRWNP
ncbi:hypothetical protein COO60DRAFT_1466724 [Scenedesmus sp. NREL 46B-D3]|nr:hypothetical protein COO60DRAFT_1466724 [Scenedesmus sp. NREL 46B-D3]